MDIHKNWEKALKNTEIVRPRVQGLLTFKDTHISYILLSESSINVGDTVVRKGEVIIEKPSLILPPNVPQFFGFEFEQNQNMDENSVMNFFLVRGISIPSLRYNNKTSFLEIYEGSLSKAITYYRDHLQQRENVHTGLITGPEECWQFSVLIYSCTQVVRNLDVDIRNLLNAYKKRPK